MYKKKNANPCVNTKDKMVKSFAKNLKSLAKMRFFFKMDAEEKAESHKVFYSLIKISNNFDSAK